MPPPSTQEACRSTPSHPHSADSLLGSLCREMGKVLSRRSQIHAQLPRCRDAGLIRRLQRELERMAVRQAEVHAVGLALRSTPGLDPFGVAFLVELCRRHSLA
ncbi:hypothetical protein KBY97_12015 [Synechococcus sp. ATX 2A4]|nr:hypothetical protein [Synechococcus sp. ATX 2A4]